MKNLPTFEEFKGKDLRSGGAQGSDTAFEIGCDFPYVMKFFSKYNLTNEIKDIPVYVISAEDWPEGKSMRTQNDRKGGIEIHEKHVGNDESEGWLIHEVGHVLDLRGDRMPYLVSRDEFNGYPNEDDEQTPMFYHFNYLIDRGMSEDEVMNMMKTSYSDSKGDSGTWNDYKDKFFRAYYNVIKNES